MSSRMQPLPIDDVLGDLIVALRESPCVVLQAPTGTGKTTRVPGAVLDAAIAPGQVVMLEPRRVAARAAARRIAQERHVVLGEEVGYQVRFDDRAGPKTRLRIVTDGILLRMLQTDPFLESVGAVVFDEFHERGLNVDLALGMVRRIQQTVRPDLRIVVMSATLGLGSARFRDADSGSSARLDEQIHDRRAGILQNNTEGLPEIRALPAFLGHCPVIVAGARSHPVEIEYLPGFSREPLPDLAMQGVARLLTQTPGDLLVFMPGVGEIRQTLDRLEPLAREQNLTLQPLYGDLTPEQQDAVLSKGTRRRVIVSTNVAETSVTVEGVTGVVDTGLVRLLRFEPGLGLDRLSLEKISQASADQRAGRAGRTQPGVCLRLWGERDQRALPEQTEPEVRRIDLASAVLQLSQWGENPRDFPWYETPPAAALDQAELLLSQLGLVKHGALTERGKAVSTFPLAPRLGCLLLAGATFGVRDRVALAAALLSERDPFVRNGAGPRRPTSHASESDVVDRVVAMEDFERSGVLESACGRLNPGAAKSILRVRDDLKRLFRSLKLPPAEPVAHADEGLQRALLAAFPDRLARRREPDQGRAVMVGGRGIRLAVESAVLEAELFLCVTADAGGTEALVRQASAVQREWLPPEGLETVEAFGFDTQHERVTATRRTMWLGLTIADIVIKLPEGDQVALVLAEAAGRQLEQVLPKDDEILNFLARVRCLRSWRPDLDLPPLDDAHLARELPSLCAGCRTFADLRRADWSSFLRGLLTWPQLQTLDREAPERWPTRSGKRIALRYEVGRPPILAARIQDLFGLAETPRIAGGRVPVLLHLLAPNMRPQQVTDDLKSFWINTYPQVRKDLRRRYPKHAWPENPWDLCLDRESST